MQNSNSKINICKNINSLLFIFILSPFIIIALCQLLPTFDDWTYFTTPYLGDFSKELFMPENSYWRPFDKLFGYVLGLRCTLFPTLNHITIYVGHVLCCLMVYRLGKILDFNIVSRNISTLYFFLSPAILGTVLGIDSINQVYSQFWSLAAIIVYISYQSKYKYIAWLICAYIATLSKENGITFFVIPPLFAYAFNKISLKRAFKDISLSLIFVVIYFILRYLLTPSSNSISATYLDYSIFRFIKNISTFVGLTWVSVDYISIIYPPQRNIFFVIGTLAMSIPLYIYILKNNISSLFSRTIIILIICHIIAVSPHLATIFTTMHPYAGLGIAAIIVAYLTNKAIEKRKRNTTFRKDVCITMNNNSLNISLLLYITSCIFTACHHYQQTYQSGMLGRRLSIQAVQKTRHPVDRVYNISIDDERPKYSSFCVTPIDAFGWGRSTCIINNYEWPKEVHDTTIVKSPSNSAEIKKITQMAISKGYQKVWIVRGDSIDILY